MAAAAKTAAPFGTWTSPITSEVLTAKSTALSAVVLDGAALYWNEGRPSEGGRVVVVRLDNGVQADCVPEGWNVRSRVHEYGGGAYCVGDGDVYFVQFESQSLFVAARDDAGTPRKIAGESGERFADLVWDGARKRVVCVREAHTDSGEPVASVVAVDVASGEVVEIASGMDFYAGVAIHPSGRVAWMAWNHPSMPWDATGIYVEGREGPICVTGGKRFGERGSVSAMQPVWGEDGWLYYLSDVTGWWGLWKKKVTLDGVQGEAEKVFGMDGVEIGGPLWMFGAQNYWLLPQGAVLAKYKHVKEAGTQLAVVSANGAVAVLDTPFSSIGHLSVSTPSEGGALPLSCIAGSATDPIRVATAVLDLEAAVVRDWRTVKVGSGHIFDKEFLSVPRTIEFPTTGEKSAYLIYYPPTSREFDGPDDGSLPPLLVKSHGGPTSAASTAYNAGIQYFTSRGFAVADINYGGSTGYGRSFRERLLGNWGIVDVDDCANAALFLASEGLVDRNKMAISGGSAGGFTTLACLAFRNDVFRAGASYYGVADLNLLAKETHKFESRYLDSLVGPWPSPVYDERSPVNSAQLLKCPLIQFQGLDDKVVPPSQAQTMFKALKENGIKTSLVEFAGEGHGFRAAASIRRSLDGELWFYGKCFGFEPEMPSDFDPPRIY